MTWRNWLGLALVAFPLCIIIALGFIEIGWKMLLIIGVVAAFMTMIIVGMRLLVDCR